MQKVEGSSPFSRLRGSPAGLASGLLTTGHELGAAFGASIVSAIAFGSGAAGFVTGYGHGALAGAVIAAILAIVSLVAIPTTRSAGGPQLAMHWDIGVAAWKPRSFG
jgi:hypothetical protein